MLMSTEGQAGEPAAAPRVRTSTVVVALLLIALLLVSALAVVFYVQAQDFRGAKYRAQYTLVMEIYDSIPSLNESLEDVVDDVLDNGFRRSAAAYAQATAEAISGACHSIEVMYPSDEDKAVTFASLAAAFASLADTAETAYDQLTDPTPDVSQPVEEALVESATVIMQIRSLVYEGVDPEVPLEDVSYDLLDRMNLVSLASAAEALDAAQP
ncbi:TPA: hypothetical protein HA259_07835 [Thermoplasmata archaeon]|nr:hypothetical protein [Thermoplasmata archaeon]